MLTELHLPTTGTFNQSGFSLMELAIVLMIIGTLMGGVLVAVSQATLSSRRNATSEQMSAIEEALYGFAQVNGRLPCPTTAGQNGLEQQNLAAPAQGTCTVWYGFVPAGTLGLRGSFNTDGLLLDPWQNPYRYVVAQYSRLGDYVYTDANTLRDFYGTPVTNDDGDASDPLGDSNNMLTVDCAPPKCNPVVTVSEVAPALILSMGANWPTFDATTSSANEVNNAEDDSGTYALPNSNTFIDSEFNEDLFDDQLLWLSPYVLFNRMVSAGQLP